MKIEKNITGLPMLFALLTVKPYIQSGKIKTSENLNIDEIIQANQNMGGDLHMLIAQILEKITQLQTCNIYIKLADTDIIQLQALAGSDPNKILSLKQIPACGFRLSVMWETTEVKDIRVNIASIESENLPSMEFSFGYLSGGTGSYINIDKFNQYKEKIETIARNFMINKTVDTWIASQNTAGFENLPADEQTKICQGLEKAYKDYYVETTEKFAKFDLTETIGKLQTIVNQVMKPVETIEQKLNFQVDIEIHIGEYLEIKIDYKG